MTARDDLLDAVPRRRARLGRADFTPGEMIEELHRAGSVYADSTIRTHVVSRMCGGAPDGHAVVFNDFERVGPGRYRLSPS